MTRRERTRDAELEELLLYIKRTRNFDFTAYKRPSLVRRIAKRMRAVGIDGCLDYVDFLEVQPEEFSSLFNTILINVTGFFRDRPAWDHLAREVLPKLLAAVPAGHPVRVWCAGCSTGEEAYTMAMVLAEELGVEAFRERVKIYCTDAAEEALLVARQASYPAKALEGAPAGLADKYFERQQTRLIFRPELRRMIVFGDHDLVQDSPISRLDLLVCRNTLMYFNAEAQARIIASFHFALKDRGVLFLGRAETLLNHSALFVPSSLRHRIFAKVPRPLRDVLPAFSHAPADAPGKGQPRQLTAFDALPVVQVVVGEDGNLVLANAAAGRLFGLGPDDVGRPFSELAMSYQPLELRSLLDQVRSERRVVRRTGVELKQDGVDRSFEVEVAPLVEEGRLAGVSVVFSEVSQLIELQRELQSANRELESAYEKIQATNEEMETTNEELKSMNEELETTNEELQSTNEELETMNEELQSTNQEIQTINEELRRRTEESNLANAFLESVLASVRASIIVVDRELTVISWNGWSENLWGLRSQEVKGRTLPELDFGLSVKRLEPALQDVLAGKRPSAQIGLGAVNRRGKRIRCRVSVSPLFGAERQVAGAIVQTEEASERPPGAARKD